MASDRRCGLRQRKPISRRFCLAGIIAAALIPAGCSTDSARVLTPAKADTDLPDAWRNLTIPTEFGPMPARLYLPPGKGPFPLASIHHGTDQELSGRLAMRMPQYDALTAWLLAHDHAVLVPLRPGHGRAGGKFAEDQRGCGKADYFGAGLATARFIDAALRHMRQYPEVQSENSLVIGTSAGGWGAIAYASQNPNNVRAYISFAGGRGGRNRGRANQNCAPERLVEAAGRFGATARIPGLWIYAENDSWFPPQLARSLADAYRGGGAPLESVMLPASSREGHFVIQETASRWQPALEAFLNP